MVRSAYFVGKPSIFRRGPVLMRLLGKLLERPAVQQRGAAAHGSGPTAPPRAPAATALSKAATRSDGRATRRPEPRSPEGGRLLEREAAGSSNASRSRGAVRVGLCAEEPGQQKEHSPGRPGSVSL